MQLKKGRKMSRSNKLNWAVFDISTGFRLTGYTTRTSATIEMRAGIQIKQHKYENDKGV
jgi:hypothetical protein